MAHKCVPSTSCGYSSDRNHVFFSPQGAYTRFLIDVYLDCEMEVKSVVTCQQFGKLFEFAMQLMKVWIEGFSSALVGTCRYASV